MSNSKKYTTCTLIILLPTDNVLKYHQAAKNTTVARKLKLILELALSFAKKNNSQTDEQHLAIPVPAHAAKALPCLGFAGLYLGSGGPCLGSAAPCHGSAAQSLGFAVAFAGLFAVTYI